MSAVALTIAAALLLVAAWLRAAGTAVSRIPRADALRDAADEMRGASAVAKLLEARDSISPAVGLVSTALLLLSAVLGSAVVGSGETAAAAVGLAAVVGLLVFLLGDLLPRTLGRRRPRPIAYLSSSFLSVAVGLGGWANELLPDNGEDFPEAEIPEGDEESDEQERELIDSVIEFGGTIVREIMTPRPDMVAVDVTAALEELVSITSDEGFSRVPVISEGDVVGMVIIKDLLPMLSEGQRPTVAEVMRPVDFVPETKLASALLTEMQSNHTHQMIVVDEYGDVAGLVTIEDLLEELVGEIADETDEDEMFITPRNDGTWDVDARLPVDELGEIVGVDLPDEDWDTVGGLVLGLAERVPNEGEQFAHGPLRLTVTRMQGRRISEVLVSVQEPAETS